MSNTQADSDWDTRFESQGDKGDKGWLSCHTRWGYVLTQKKKYQQTNSNITRSKSARGMVLK